MRGSGFAWICHALLSHPGGEALPCSVVACARTGRQEPYGEEGFKLLRQARPWLHPQAAAVSVVVLKVLAEEPEIGGGI
jgi:hypothetical protein